jgi:hypothetical protein
VRVSVFQTLCSPSLFFWLVILTTLSLSHSCPFLSPSFFLISLFSELFLCANPLWPLKGFQSISICNLTLRFLLFLFLCSLISLHLICIFFLSCTPPSVTHIHI